MASSDPVNRLYEQPDSAVTASTTATFIANRRLVVIAIALRSATRHA
jgi:hypothetical protein